MNKIGIHIGYWWGSGIENNLDTMLDFAHQAQMDVLEITPPWIKRMTSEQRKTFKDKTQEYGITVTVNGGLDDTTDISADSSVVRTAGIEYCKRVLESLPEVGAINWSGLNYSAWLRKPIEADLLVEKERAKENSIQSMREIIKTAEDVGIDYCFEVVNRFEQFLFNTSIDAVDFAKAVDSPRAKILLDVFHMNIEEDNIVEAIRYAANQGVLGHLHVGESNRRIPGTGDTHIDWQSIGNVLTQMKYTGAIVMEPFVLTTAHNAKKICVWRDLSGMNAHIDLDKLAKDAKIGGAFLRGIL